VPLERPHVVYLCFRRGYPRGPGLIRHFTRADPRPTRGTEIPSLATITSTVVAIWANNTANGAQADWNVGRTVRPRRMFAVSAGEQQHHADHANH
jgi:hypothetical protein